MRKIALTILAAATLSLTAAAQSSMLSNDDNRPYWGVRVGIDISSTAGEIIDQYSNSAGFTLSGIYNVPVWQNLYFEPGLTLYYDTFGMTLISQDPHTRAATDINGSIRNIGLRVPLNFGYRFDFTDNMSLSLYTGPQLNVNFDASMHVNDNSQGLMDKGFKRVDLQWGFGGSMQFFHSYYISISGGVGITKAFSTKYDEFRRNTVNLSLGYNF